MSVAPLLSELRRLYCLVQRLRAEYEKPRVSYIELLLRERFTDERVRRWLRVCASRCWPTRAVQVRHLLFQPDPAEFRMFHKLLASPAAGAPDDHPQVALRLLGQLGRLPHDIVLFCVLPRSELFN